MAVGGHFCLLKGSLRGISRRQSTAPGSIRYILLCAPGANRLLHSNITADDTPQPPQIVDLLEQYRGLCALGTIKHDEDQVRVVMQVRFDGSG